MGSFPDTDLSTRDIVGIAVAGGVLGLILLSLCCLISIFCCFRKKDGTLSLLPQATEQQVVMFREPLSLAHIEQATGQFDEDHVLSRTRYGIVFKAILQVL